MGDCFLEEFFDNRGLYQEADLIRGGTTELNRAWGSEAI